MCMDSIFFRKLQTCVSGKLLIFITEQSILKELVFHKSGRQVKVRKVKIEEAKTEIY